MRNFVAVYSRLSTLRISALLRAMPGSAALLALLALSANAGCNRSSDSSPKASDAIVTQIGDSVLRESDVLARIPAGITSADSALLYDAIVQNWLEKRLLIDLAELNLPAVEHIDRLVEEYRVQLLTDEYRRVMAATNAGQVTDKEVADYYASHRKEFLLGEPIVEGVYVKTDSSSPQLADIRRWLFSDDGAGIGQLETYGLDDAVQYDDFRSTWVSWSSVTALFPGGIPLPSEGLHPGFTFDKKTAGEAYLLLVTDVIDAGETAPLDYAARQIRRTLAEERRRDYDSDLLLTLYRQALSSGKILKDGYVPRRFRSKN